jgi:hypothetical protein
VPIPKDWTKEDFNEPEGTQASLGAGKPVVKMEILFDDLDYYQHAKERIKEILKDYEGVSIKEPKGV